MAIAMPMSLSARHGAAYVIFGKGDDVDGSRALHNMDLQNLSSDDGFKIEGAGWHKDSDDLGRSVSSVGDVNGDGCDDIMVAAPYTETRTAGTAWDVGSAYIIYGGKDVGASGERIIGTQDADWISGSKDNDHIVCRGGADVLLGHAGNDTFEVPDLKFARIDGDEGQDSLLVKGSDGSALEFTKDDIADKVSGMEVIDIADGTKEIVMLSAQAVESMTDDDNTLHLTGDDGDIVKLSEFTRQGDTTQILNGHDYYVYESSQAHLWIESGVTVNVIYVSPPVR